MDELQDYMRRIMIAFYRLDSLYDESAKDKSVKPNTLYLLYALEDGKPHSQKSLCEEWKFSRTTLNTITKECERDGYITLKHVAGTKRELTLCLTDAGKAFTARILGDVYRAKNEGLQEAFQTLSPDFVSEVEFFVSCFEKSFANLKRKDEKT